MAFYTRVIDDALDLIANILDIAQQEGWTVHYADTYEVTVSVRNSIYVTYKNIGYVGGAVVQARLSTGYTPNGGQQGGYLAHMPVPLMALSSSYIDVGTSATIYHFSITDDYFHIFKVKEYTSSDGLLIGEYIGVDGQRAGAYYSQGSIKPGLGEKLGVFIPRDSVYAIPGSISYDTGWSLFRKQPTTARPGFKLRINYYNYTAPDQGEIYLHKLSHDGTESDEDGSIYYGNDRITLPREIILTTGTNNGWSDAFIVFDSTLSSRFDQHSAPNTRNYVVARNVSGQWKYDNNNNLVDFTPLPSDLVIGRVFFSGPESIASADAWGYAKPIKDLEDSLINEWDVAYSTKNFLQVGFAVKINQIDYQGTPSIGEFYLHKNSLGDYPSDEDGSITHNGSEVTLKKGAVYTNSNNSGWSEAVLMYDTSNTNRFTMDGALPGQNLVAANQVNGQWYYDNNSQLVSFNLTGNEIVIGRVYFGSGLSIDHIEPWASAKSPQDAYTGNDRGYVGRRMRSIGFGNRQQNLTGFSLDNKCLNQYTHKIRTTIETWPGSNVYKMLGEYPGILACNIREFYPWQRVDISGSKWMVIPQESTEDGFEYRGLLARVD